MDAEKSRAVLFGLAIGDAIGYPTEFMPLPKIKVQYGDTGISDLPDPPLFTDDAQMTIAIAEALVSSGDRDTETIMVAVREEVLKWLHSPENNRAPGNACLQGVKNMERKLRAHTQDSEKPSLETAEQVEFVVSWPDVLH